MANASRDENSVPTLIAASSSDGSTPVRVYADPTTHRLLVAFSTTPGDVVGPASSTDNAVARFDGTTGKLLQNSVTTISDTGAIVSNANAAAAPAAQTGSLLQLNQANATTARAELDSYAASAFFTGVRRNGTGASPSQVLAGEQIGGFNGIGYTNSAATSGPIASFRVYAGENLTSSAQGGIATIAAVPIGSTTLSDQLSVYGDTGVGIGLASATTVPLGGLEVAKNSAASFPAAIFSGTVFTGGSGSTNMPHVLIRPTGTAAASSWSTSGTGIGMNMASGFAGNFLDFRVNGGSSVYTISSAGLAIGTFQSSSTFNGSNIAVPNGATATSTLGNIAQTQIGGATTNGRMLFRGSSASTITANNSYAGIMFGDQGITEAASGTHPIIATVAMKTNTMTNGAGATTDMTTLYIEGAPTGITPTNPATALWVASGPARFDGNVNLRVTTVGSLGSAATVGATAFVTDALAPTWGTAVTGGGAVKVPVFADGTNWIVG